MLPDQCQSRIRAIYKDIALPPCPHFGRAASNYMVAEISKTLAGDYDKDRRASLYGRSGDWYR